MDNPALTKLSPAPSSVPVRQTTNFLTIQALRAVAALMVVAYHAFDLWAVRITQSSGGYWTNGAAGVDIFFVISGFVMVVSSRKLVGQPGAALTFMRHRIVRIVPLYWLLTTSSSCWSFSSLGLPFDRASTSTTFCALTCSSRLLTTPGISGRCCQSVGP